MCDQIDIGVYSDPQSHLNEMGPILCAYDRIPGGMGFSQRLYDIHNELFINAYDLTAKCKCKDGCPSCVGPGGEFGGGSKKESLAILEILTNYSGNTDN
jgi:DEAD/DEAH box helicase domain-containing protein